MKINRLFVVYLLAPAFLAAQPGSLDGDFDGDGKVTSSVQSGDDYANAVAVQPDGKIVVAGVTQTAGAGSQREIAVLRYRPDGSPDNSFSLNGEADFGIATAADDVATGVFVQPDGKILMAGTSLPQPDNYAFSLARMNPNGTSFDGGFGTGGKMMFSFGTANDECYGLAVQPDGKILVIGGAEGNSGNYDAAIARLLANGDFDPAFSGDGKALFALVNGADDYLLDVVVQPDGKIVCSGTIVQDNDADIAVIRLHPNGTFDNSFSFDGKLTTSFGGNSSGRALALQPDGKIVVAGYTNNGTDTDVALVCYQPDGSLDTGFGGGDGKLALDYDGYDFASAVLVQPDGKIVIAGTTSDPPDFLVARFLPDGSPDVNFGQSGLLTIDFDGEPDEPLALALAPDGRIVVAGASSDGTYFRVAVARVLSGLSVGVDDFGPASSVLVWPNPVEDQAVLSYELLNDGPVSLYLCDLAGRVLHVFQANANRNAGQNTETLVLPEGLAGGYYLLELETKQGRAGVRLLVR